MRDNKPKWGILRISKLAKSRHAKSYVDPNKKDAFNNPKFQDATIIKVEYTNFNSIVLLSNGKVFSKGKNAQTRGISNPIDSKQYEQIIFKNEDSDQILAIYNISAGAEHVLALDEKYNIWGWGKNEFKQVSIRAKETIEPVRLKIVSVKAFKKRVWIFVSKSML